MTSSRTDNRADNPTSAAIYARVSSARQKKDETIGSQTAALRAHAEQLGLDVPDEWVFEDEGHSGATLVRPALERLRDLVAGIGIDVVLCYSPDRLARRFAYQALLIEEFTRVGTRVEFIKGPRGDTPEDQLLVQFQGMFAEYEKAQIMERYRRGKTHRAQTGSINVLGGAPFGYRYVRKSPHAGAGYEIIEHEAALVAELFRRYAEDGASLAELTRWLSDSGVPTRTGKHRWDRSVIWGMLRNPAYAGRAVFGKTMIVHESPGLNRVARMQGRATPRASKTVDRPREQGIEIPVPAIVSEETFARVVQRLAENKRFAARNSTAPSLLQGLAACAACGYGYYRTTTRTTNKKIHYYRCLGSDNYRYEGGRVCVNKPVRADYLDTVVWDHLTALLADPALIRAEIDKRLQGARSSDPAARERQRLDAALAKAVNGITRMIEALGEQLITIDELRARMPDLRARETNLRNQIQALDTQLADREAYLALAADLEGFLTQLHTRAETSTLDERRRVLRLLVKDILIGPEKITIRHRIPLRQHTTRDTAPTRRVNIPNIAQCVGGVLSPLLANIALSVLDEHMHEPWRPGGTMSTAYLRSRRRIKGLPRRRIIRYADDFVVLVHGTQEHVEALREDIAQVLAPMGLRLSPAKTRIVHMSDGFDFLGFRIQWKRKRGTNKWHVYTFIADRPIRSVKAKIRALTNRKSQRNPGTVLTRLNQVMRGWTNYFRHAACKRTLSRLFHFVWWRMIRWLRTLHRWTWTDVRRRFTTPEGRWKPIAVDGVALFNPASTPITRYRYRGNTIPNPWASATTA